MHATKHDKFKLNSSKDNRNVANVQVMYMYIGEYNMVLSQ